MKKLSFIIVTYKIRDLLEKCVSNLVDVYENKEIIVVDNDSQDGSAEMIKEKFGNNKEVILIETDNNGISAGNNLALEKATGDYYIYIGVDSFPTKEAIKKLLEFMESEENKQVGIVTPKLVMRDGAIDWDAHRGFSTPWSALTHFSGLDRMFPKSQLLNQYFLGFKDFTKPHEIDVCISHFMFMRKSVMEKIGKWDETFWVYGEDLDICYRTKQAGFKIIYLPNIEVLHYKGAIVGRKSSQDVRAPISSQVRDKLTKGSVIAMELFYRKHLSKRYPFILNWIVYLGIFLLKRLRQITGK